MKKSKSSRLKNGLGDWQTLASTTPKSGKPVETVIVRSVFSNSRQPLPTSRLFMPLKKSELYSSLWASCDELRGGMDASQYKDYVLVLLFMKYVSDKAASQKGYLLDVP